MMKVLDVTKATSDEWQMFDTVGYIQVDIHTGGTWTLQWRSSEDIAIWIPMDITFTAVGAKDFNAPRGVTMRLAGGTVGARATVWGVQ